MFEIYNNLANIVYSFVLIKETQLPARSETYFLLLSRVSNFLFFTGF